MLVNGNKDDMDLADLLSGLIGKCSNFGISALLL